MFISDNHELVLEQFELPTDSQEQPDDSSTIEFENVKTFILYNQFNFIKSKIKLYCNIESDPDKNELLTQLHDFIDLIQFYFNTLTYPQLLQLLDNVTSTFAAVYGLSVEPLQFTVNNQEEPQEAAQNSE